jgi:hypothetical protein
LRTRSFDQKFTRLKVYLTESFFWKWSFVPILSLLEHIFKKMGSTEIVALILLLYSGQKYSLGFGVRGIWVRESGLDQDPYQKKYTLTSNTQVPVVQIEQMRTHLKGLSARIVMSSESMVTCASGLLPNPTKVPNFQYKVWCYSIVQKFHNEGKKIQDSKFWAYLRPWSGLSPKISNLSMMVFYRLKISYWW